MGEHTKINWFHYFIFILIITQLGLLMSMTYKLNVSVDALNSIMKHNQAEEISNLSHYSTAKESFVILEAQYQMAYKEIIDIKQALENKKDNK